MKLDFSVTRREEMRNTTTLRQIEENWITSVLKKKKVRKTHLLMIGIGNENRQSSTTTGTGLIVRGECIGIAGA